MSKVYLFRKIDNASELQSNVYEEAAISLVEHVLSGSTGTICNYGDIISYDFLNTECTAANDDVKNDIVARVICDIFKHVYTMELNMEINISIKYYELFLETQRDLIDLEATTTATTTTPTTAHASEDEHMKRITNTKNIKEHFVSTPKDVFLYIDKKLKHISEEHISHAVSVNSLFVIKIKQTNLEKSKKFSGKLNLLHFMHADAAKKTTTNEDAANAVATETETPLCSLLRIVRALASNNKTHIRYHNIRLMQVLKDTVGANENTVILNYIQTTRAVPATFAAKRHFNAQVHEYSADDWKALYHKEREKYARLKQKISSMELRNAADKTELKGFIEILEQYDITVSLDTKQLTAEVEQLSEQLRKKQRQLERSTELCEKYEERVQMYAQTLNDALLEQQRMQEEMSCIKDEMDLSMEESTEVHHIVQQLAMTFEHTMDDVEKKDLMLNRLNALLAKTSEDMVRQKNSFREKLNEFSEIFTKLWRQQAETMLSQEKQRETQLNEMFDAICTELRETYNVQLEKVRTEAKRNESELKKLNERHQDLLYEEQLRQNKRMAKKKK